ncbi:unnamed protein product [Fraxinus pennsylvanica]|uniref:Uncharacterized protein n=1 Tax=Fraxinus pennsylvanica TaxID=56036 RepID=A0AAD2EBX0_9LAMI|nr:unnamed protein product [Fraxinus pennsylvanica]
MSKKRNKTRVGLNLTTPVNAVMPAIGVPHAKVTILVNFISDHSVLIFENFVYFSGLYQSSMRNSNNSWFLSITSILLLAVVVDYISAADYVPTDNILLNCGGPPDSSDTDNRKWTSDIGSKFASSRGNSSTTSAATQKPSVPSLQESAEESGKGLGGMDIEEGTFDVTCKGKKDPNASTGIDGNVTDSKSSGMSMSIGGQSLASTDSDGLTPSAVFSQIMNPKGR